MTINNICLFASAIQIKPCSDIRKYWVICTKLGGFPSLIKHPDGWNQYPGVRALLSAPGGQNQNLPSASYQYHQQHPGLCLHPTLTAGIVHAM